MKRRDFFTRLAGGVLGITVAPSVLESVRTWADAAPTAIATVDEIKAVSGGAFDEFAQRIFDDLWKSWKRMELRQLDLA
jgi:hypothetical protein